MSSPSTGCMASRTSSTMRPKRSRMTRREPAAPDSRSLKANSIPSCPLSSTLVKPTTCAAASPSGYWRLYSGRKCSPLMLRARTCKAMGSSTWRCTHTNVGCAARRRFISGKVIPSSLAASPNLGSFMSTSSGIAHTLLASTLVAKIKPLRSKIRPRLGGNSKVRAKRTSP